MYVCVQEAGRERDKAEAHRLSSARNSGGPLFSMSRCERRLSVGVGVGVGVGLWGCVWGVHVGVGVGVWDKHCLWLIAVLASEQLTSITNFFPVGNSSICLGCVDVQGWPRPDNYARSTIYWNNSLQNVPHTYALYIYTVLANPMCGAGRPCTHRNNQNQPYSCTVYTVFCTVYFVRCIRYFRQGNHII